MEKSFETEVLTRLGIIESKLDNYKEVKEVAYRADTLSKENKEDIDEIKENNKWLKRTIVGEVIGLVFIAIAMFIGLK